MKKVNRPPRNEFNEFAYKAGEAMGLVEPNPFAEKLVKPLEALKEYKGPRPNQRDHRGALIKAAAKAIVAALGADKGLDLGHALVAYAEYKRTNQKI